MYNDKEGDTDMFYNKDIYISAEYCDTTVYLGNHQFFYLLQNAMTDGFEVLDCGNRGLGKRCNGYWAVTKTKIEIYKRPFWAEEVTVKATYTTDKRLRVYVNTEMFLKNGERVARGCQELCILDLDTHRPKRLSDTCIPLDTEDAATNSLTFEKFSKADTLTSRYEHTVRSQNIDMSCHVNNIEYIRMAMDLFTVSELENLDVSSMEVHYIGECREGDILSCERYDSQGKKVIQIKNNDRLSFEMQINCR